MVASKLHVRMTYELCVCVCADVLYVRTYTITLCSVLSAGLCWLEPG